MKMKVVIYARYSSDKQTEQSIEGQLRECYEFAKRNDYVVVNEYIDRAVSGMTDNRPAFLHDFENRDYTKPENRFRLLEIFINKIYLYDDYAIIVYNGIKNSSLKIDFCNKKTEPKQKFGFGSFGSPGPVRTDDLPVNSRLLHR